MKINKFIFVFLIFFIKPVFADLKILEWHQKNTFNKVGQEIDVTVRLRAEGLLYDRQYYKSWTYIFDPKSRINVLEAEALPPSKYKSTFGDNKLNIEFSKLYNNKEVVLHFKYQQLNDDKVKYIKREWTHIPKFAAGANGSLTVIVMPDMDIYSTNDTLTADYYGNYHWSGIVPKNGVAELFEMTMKEAEWLVSTTVNITNRTTSLNNLKITIPMDFVGGNNEILEYNVSTSQGVGDDIIEKKDDKITVNFKKYQNSTGFIKIDARIKNNYNNFYWLNNFDINETLKINNEYIAEYNTLINNIKQRDTSDLPIHIKIAKWVYENIVYDESFVGKKLTSKAILELKRGVCEHYALLYQDLLRSIGIPAKIVTGISYEAKKNKFENHAWVMVNYNSQWIPIDPTWGIYSGKLPISHIFMYNDVGSTSWSGPEKTVNNLTIETINDAFFVK